MVNGSGTMSMRPVDGTFYAFVKYSPRMRSEDYSSALLDKKKVLVTPGSAFGNQGEGYFRLSFATDDDTIRQGVELIDKFNQEN
jgi:aspartate/methionine/tyrosine aminotransferase